MQLEEWAKIKFFNPSENWGDTSIIKYPLVKLLDVFRGRIGKPVKILCGTQGDHVNGSKHYIGEAVDIVFPWATKEELWDMYILAVKVGFRGIGVYPHWKLDGQEIGGLHLDIRETDEIVSWLGILDNQGKQVYIPATRANLRSHGF